MTSDSRANYSSIYIEWKETLTDAEYESAINDLRAAIERVDDLPPDAEEPYLRELSVGETYPILMVVVADTAELGELARLEVARDLKKGLDDLPGVRTADDAGRARTGGPRDRRSGPRLALRPDPDRHRRAHPRHNLNLPAGTFTGSEGEATLRATGDYQSVEEILDTVLRESPSGTYVRLRDVARVEEKLEKRRFYGRYNGNPSLMIGLSKDNDADLSMSRPVCGAGSRRSERPFPRVSS